MAPSGSKTTSTPPANTSPEQPAVEPIATATKKSKKSKRSKDKSSHHKSTKHKDKKGRKSSESDKTAVTVTAAVEEKSKESTAVTVSAVKSDSKSSEAGAETDSAATAEPAQEQLADAIISLNPDTHDILDEEINQESKKQDEKPKASQAKPAPKTTPVVASKVKTSPSKSTVVASPQATAKAPATSPTSGQMPTKRTVEKTTTVTRVRSSSAGATLSTITVVRLVFRPQVQKGDPRKEIPGAQIGGIQVFADHTRGNKCKQNASTIFERLAAFHACLFAQLDCSTYAPDES